MVPVRPRGRGPADFDPDITALTLGQQRGHFTYAPGQATDSALDQAIRTVSAPLSIPAHPQESAAAAQLPSPRATLACARERATMRVHWSAPWPNRSVPRRLLGQPGLSGAPLPPSRVDSDRLQISSSRPWGGLPGQEIAHPTDLDKKGVGLTWLLARGIKKSA